MGFFKGFADALQAVVALPGSSPDPRKDHGASRRIFAGRQRVGGAGDRMPGVVGQINRLVQKAAGGKLVNYRRASSRLIVTYR